MDESATSAVERTIETIVESHTRSFDHALGELARLAPDAPLLSCGQTVFWDEPMKVGVALAAARLKKPRRFVAAVHDTDYFAKHPGGKPRPGRFRALPHNDTTTRGLWSAAGEFSALFGSETVITREQLAAAGLRIARLARERPSFLDEATEAWGWRGLASLDEHAPITREVAVGQIFSEMQATLDWALDLSLECIGGQARPESERLADELRTRLCDAAEEDGSVADLYRRLILPIFELVSGERFEVRNPLPLEGGESVNPALIGTNARGGDAASESTVQIETTTTSAILRFNAQTCDLPRFGLLSLFVDPATRTEAIGAYDQAIASSGLYETARFGSGAIPFDLVIPGLGRGTIRLGHRGVVIQTVEPQFITIPKDRPIQGLSDLARLVEAKFGSDCAIVGKAVTLIGMLAAEYVFIFHEGASGYVGRSRGMHAKLKGAGHDLRLNPILRVRYDAWSALTECDAWLKLPEPFQRTFGAEELSAPSFARRWKDVVAEEEANLAALGNLRRSADLIRHLDETFGGAWNTLAREHQQLHDSLEGLKRELDVMREARYSLYKEVRELRARRSGLERAKGDHFRAAIFEKSPTKEDVARRTRFDEDLRALDHELASCRARVKQSLAAQSARVKDPELQMANESRRRIETEAELKRLSLIRQAVTTARGLVRAGQRPSAWWFPLVSPSGCWFKETVRTAEAYLEPLDEASCA